MLVEFVGSRVIFHTMEYCGEFNKETREILYFENMMKLETLIMSGGRVEWIKVGEMNAVETRTLIEELKSRAHKLKESIVPIKEEKRLLAIYIGNLESSLERRVG